MKTAQEVDLMLMKDEVVWRPKKEGNNNSSNMYILLLSMVLCLFMACCLAKMKPGVNGLNVK